MHLKTWTACDGTLVARLDVGSEKPEIATDPARCLFEARRDVAALVADAADRDMSLGLRRRSESLDRWFEVWFRWTPASRAWSLRSSPTELENYARGRDAGRTEADLERLFADHAGCGHYVATDPGRPGMLRAAQLVAMPGTRFWPSAGGGLLRLEM